MEGLGSVPVPVQIFTDTTDPTDLDQAPEHC
jgi:hypothetical protein